MKDRAKKLFARLQDEICSALEDLDGKARFREDRWSHSPQGGGPSGGGGATRVLERGEVFEKAGVSLADVKGQLTDKLASRLGIAAQPFNATGISLVIHPLSPMVPTVHMNLRYLQLVGEPDEGAKQGEADAWFGGGADLTPYYLYEEDAEHFHRTWRDVCARHDPSYYQRFKKRCDGYFRIEHRDEARGVGGIFFDYLREDPEGTFAFVEDAGCHFLDAYLPIVERRRAEPWWDRERRWQLVRRGRYVEFNLIYDRGTLFGLETRGRTESILMSLPPLVSWVYGHRAESGSREEALLEVLRRPRDWV